MWLSKDERQLLRGYFHNIGKVDDSQAYDLMELVRLLSSPGRKIRCRDEPDREEEWSKHEMEAYVNEWPRVEHANSLLATRKLIRLERPTERGAPLTGWNIALTIDGYDLGRRYSGWLSRSGLWFQEFRNHWMWLIVSFAGGILGALVVQWLSASNASYS